MESHILPGEVALVVIRHPAHGDAVNGKTIRNDVLKKLAGHRGPVCFFHDAQDMESADHDYAEEFKTLEAALAGRVRDTVCVIPLLVPRIMALTVAKATGRVWSIYKTKEEAAEHLHRNGVDVSGLRLYAGSVAVKGMGRAA